MIYSHNNKTTLEALIEQLKLQDYPIDCFKVFAILDNCTDGSEIIFQNNRFVNVVNFNGQGTLGKDQSVSLLLEQLTQDNWIDSYIFVDANRGIPSDFLSTINSALVKNSVLSGETLMLMDNLDIVDKIKAVYQKYHMNFLRQARSLFGLASQADSGVFVIKKEIVDTIGAVDFKDIDFDYLRNELLKVGNRGYTTGFFIDKDNTDGYSYDISKGLAGSDFLCEFLGKEGDLYRIKTRNKMLLNDDIEVITPTECFISKIISIYSTNNKEVEKDVANTNDELYIKLSKEPLDYKYALARTPGIKRTK